MQLSKRLQAVANLVSKGNRVADIGCDHAYISIYLAENSISPHIIAMDINQGPVNRAKENIIKSGLKHQIEIRRSDGLAELKQGEADTLLIAGMGGALMTQILNEKPELVGGVRELILQPQSEISKVRRMLTQKDFYIIKEEMLAEEGKYYVMMKAVPLSGMENMRSYRLTKEEHYVYGRLLLESRQPILRQFLEWELKRNKTILESLSKETTGNTMKRRKEIGDKIRLIYKGLDYYGPVMYTTKAVDGGSVKN